MSCEQHWWDSLSSLNEHVTAVEELARLAELYSPDRRTMLAFTSADMHDLLDAVARVDATLREQRRSLEAFFREWEEQHGAVAGDPAIGPAVSW